MNKLYKQGGSIVVEDGKRKRVYPKRSTKITGNKNSLSVHNEEAINDISSATFTSANDSKELIQQMTKIHQFAIMCAPTISQYAAVEALKNGDKDVEEMRQAYNQRRRFLMDSFKKMGLDCFEPFGAFYVFPCIKEFGMTSEEFATKFLQEEKVAIVPGTAFGDCGEGFLRISYAYSLENLKEAIGRLERFITKLRNQRQN